MTMYSEKRRFVAGAICPRCSTQDTIQVYSENGKDYRECVSCGYKDEMRFKPQSRELETRVNTPAEVKAAQEQVVKILPLGKND